MKSTRAYLTDPFQPTTGTHQERQARLEAAIGKPIEMPEEFLDRIHETLMNDPCNIKLLPSADDYYIDLLTREQLRRHPLDRSHFKSKSVVDVALKKRINTLLTIEEMKQYVAQVQLKRQNELTNILCHESAREISALLAASSQEVLDIYACHTLATPPHLLSKGRGKIMTLPIILDEKHTIDFFELLARQPDTTPSEEDISEQKERLQRIKQERLTQATADYKRNLQYITSDIHGKTNDNSEPPLDRHKIANIPGLQMREQHHFEEKIKEIEALTIDDIRDHYLHEHINPFTNKPIESIAIDFQLLTEIDLFLEKARLEDQIEAIRKHMRSYNTKIGRINPDFSGKTFMQILESVEFPVRKIPDPLLVGSIPGTAYTIIATHPVIIDQSYTTDFLELLSYWEKTTWGINPSTQLPLKSITYDCELKDDTCNFILNHHLYKLEKMPRYKRQTQKMAGKKNNWGLTTSGIFSRTAENKAAELKEFTEDIMTEHDNNHHCPTKN